MTMPLTPFSKKYPDEFLTRREDNFGVLLERIKLFHQQTRADIQDGTVSRRNLPYRFTYREELHDLKVNEKGISTEQVADEFNDMLQGCLRHQDPTAAFNIIPSPLFDIIAGITLTSLYNPNTCWDFISGKLSLYERKITRMLGSLVGWSQADGFVVTGGKQAIAYAIKCGIGRASTNHIGEMSDYVVIFSELAHFCIKHASYYLGISPENCLSISTEKSGEMDLKVFEETLHRIIAQGKRIAAVVAVAGTTIDLAIDPLLPIKKIIDEAVEKHRLDYVPYLHVDSVTSWVWLAFENNPDHLSHRQIHPNISKKIESLLAKLEGIQYADSFAADFHKTGFCPYAAGVFIAKESGYLSGMTPNRFLPKESVAFGELEVYRQTFENSRSGLGIVSIWIALRRMGLQGLREFVIYQLEVCELFKQKIQQTYSEHFEILNNHSNGWEIVIKPHLQHQQPWDELQRSSAKEQEAYTNACLSFLNHLWYGSLDNQAPRHPIIGFVRKYSRKGSHEQGLPAFLIHPTSLHYDEEAIDEMIKSIIDVKIAFDETDKSSVSIETYLCELVPPR
jgi:glutamate/tyrosine decarboxylase-like PLP-dependent enzyme